MDEALVLSILTRCRDRQFGSNHELSATLSAAPDAIPSHVLNLVGRGWLSANVRETQLDDRAIVNVSNIRITPAGRRYLREQATPSNNGVTT